MVADIEELKEMDACERLKAQSKRSVDADER